MFDFFKKIIIESLGSILIVVISNIATNANLTTYKIGVFSLVFLVAIRFLVYVYEKKLNGVYKIKEIYQNTKDPKRVTVVINEKLNDSLIGSMATIHHKDRSPDLDFNFFAKVVGVKNGKTYLLSMVLMPDTINKVHVQQGQPWKDTRVWTGIKADKVEDWFNGKQFTST